MPRVLVAVLLSAILLAACGGGSHKTVTTKPPTPLHKLQGIEATVARCEPPGGYAALLDPQAQATFYGCTHPKLLLTGYRALPENRVNICLTYALGAVTGKNKAVLKANAINPELLPPPTASALKALTVTCMLGAPGPPPTAYRTSRRPRREHPRHPVRPKPPPTAPIHQDGPTEVAARYCTPKQGPFRLQNAAPLGRFVRCVNQQLVLYGRPRQTRAMSGSAAFCITDALGHTGSQSQAESDLAACLETARLRQRG